MAISVDALNTSASLITSPPRQGRDSAHAPAPQQADLAAQGGEPHQRREQIAIQQLSGPAQTPSIRLEYHQGRPVLLLHDQKGVLIYQIPSKGTLQLVWQEAAPGWGVSEQV